MPSDLVAGLEFLGRHRQLPEARDAVEEAKRSTTLFPAEARWVKAHCVSSRFRYQLHTLFIPPADSAAWSISISAECIRCIACDTSFSSRDRMRRRSTRRASRLRRRSRYRRSARKRAASPKIRLAAQDAKEAIVIGSVVDPKNGAGNPYGLTVVPFTSGKLTAGDLLVCNFNAKSGVQGTGSRSSQSTRRPARSRFKFRQTKRWSDATRSPSEATTTSGRRRWWRTTTRCSIRWASW